MIQKKPILSGLAFRYYRLKITFSCFHKQLLQLKFFVSFADHERGHQIVTGGLDPRQRGKPVSRQTYQVRHLTAMCVVQQILMPHGRNERQEKKWHGPSKGPPWMAITFNGRGKGSYVYGSFLSDFGIGLGLRFQWKTALMARRTQGTTRKLPQPVS
jgi:hypothetical protein